MKTTILPVLSAPFGIALLAALVLAMSAFPAAAAPSLAEALDNAELLFMTAGDGEWYGQTDASHDGVDAARTGPLLDGQDSWLQTTVTGPGTLSFWWNVSSEEGADPFELYADGERLDAISGTNGVWRRKTIRMTGGGPHDVIWTYLKDEEGSCGEDCGWVDEVVWTPAGDLFVDGANGNDANDGRSWATAKATVQGAVDVATAGDTIVVADGRYEPISTANKAISICSLNGPATTLIDGSLQWARGVTNRCATLGSTASHAATFLSGFTLTNGIATYGGGSQYGTLDHCVIAGNRATSGGGSYHGTLTGCSIENNTAISDGGGSCYGTLTDCTLSGNSAKNGGGSYDGALHDCTIMGNSAEWGGGSYRGTLTGCQLFSNSATGNGGGSYAGTLTDCSLSSNHATGSGGGTYNGELASCELYGNWTDASGGGAFGGALNGCMVAGNIAVSSGGGAAEATLNNCILAHNRATAGNGGGVCGGKLSHCTLHANEAANDGGGAYDASLANCIVRGNTAANNPAVQLLDKTCRYSCLDQPVAGAANVGNVVADPLFVGESDYHLQSGSPCIDAGDNALAAGGTDFYGAPRISRGKVDMGASEYQYAPPEWAANADAETFWKWVEAKRVADYAATDYTAQYLLNVAPDAMPVSIHIDGIAVRDAGAEMQVSATAGRGVVDLANINGILVAEVGDSLTNLVLKTVPAANVRHDAETHVATVFVSSSDGSFLRARVDFPGSASGDLLPPPGLAIRPETGTQVLVGETIRLHAVVVRSDGTEIDVSQSAVWTSSKPGKATVAQGLVRGVEDEDAVVITASAMGIEASVAVRVGYHYVILNSVRESVPDLETYLGYEVERDGQDNYHVYRNGVEVTELVLPATFEHGNACYCITGLNQEAFRDCVNLRSVTVPDTVSFIGVSAFKGCTGLRSVSLPSIVNYIGEFAFADCPSLVEFTLPEDITYILESTFENCTSLTNVVVPAGVGQIDNKAFAGCENLRTAVLPDSLESIGKEAFRGCGLQGAIHLPAGVESLGAGAFKSCAGLSSATVPARITALPDELFAGCENLRTVALFTGSADNPPVLGSIGQGAFEGCENLESVTIPGLTVDGTYHGVTAIGDRAFKGCFSLADLTVPDGVESIGDEAFADVQHVYYHGPANGEPWGANQMN